MPSPVDPRNLLPSRADPVQRKARKQLEKEHAVGLTEVAVLGLIGLTLAWDIDKQVKKREEKKDKEEAEKKKREERERWRREQERGPYGAIVSRAGTTVAPGGRGRGSGRQRDAQPLGS
ncbi:hypothetical protein NUW58_g10706 [Xylaria curta]|uniref:Uncharacterized protein n=1 Tax=Xylaria curta TaxID=42375 RepID=A0ACC1MHC5_9PEZI|nr:hypothetical protein NUW58_g10706 [Xylaria curta]